MNCKWCTLLIKPGAMKIDLRDDFFHPECWLKKLQSIGKNSSSGPVQRRDGLYPDARHRDEEP